MQPQQLANAGWLRFVRGKVFAPDLPTWNPSIYDYFVVSEGLAASVFLVQRIIDAGCYPHSPSRLLIRTGARARQVRVLAKPTGIPDGGAPDKTLSFSSPRPSRDAPCISRTTRPPLSVLDGKPATPSLSPPAPRSFPCVAVTPRTHTGHWESSRSPSRQPMSARGEGGKEGNPEGLTLAPARTCSAVVGCRAPLARPSRHL